MIDSLDGNDSKYIEEKMATRYATTVDKVKDQVDGTEKTWLVRNNEAKNAAIANGLFEIVGLHTYNHIVRETASLFTIGSEYEYEGSGNVDTFAEDLEAAREMANRDLSMGRVDELSVATGSSCVLVQVLGSILNYQAIPRDKIWVAFNNTIFENNVERPANQLNIEEATAIVIQLDDADSSGNASYVAYYGRSDKYPQGRQVKYSAKKWDDVPEVGQTGEDAGTDAEFDGEAGNPMTVWQDQQGSGFVSPEYPIAIWTGSTSGYGKELLPITEGLYKQTLELDLGASRVLMSALKSARGVFAFSRDMESSNVLPEVIDEGGVVLEHGQTLATHSIPGINIKEAMAVLKEMAAITSEAWQVPAYRIGINATSVPSGAALRELNRPLIRNRDSRIQLNRSNVSRIYDIERILASMENGSATGEAIEETWVPNEVQFERDRLEVLNEKKLELEMKITHLERVAEEVFPHIDTEEQAENWIAEVKEKTPEQAPAPAQNGGRAIDRFRARQNGQAV
jgi:hypothetical protein